MQSEKLYELKQIKVVLKLTESEPLYSTEQINSPDKATEVMAQALAQLDRECCCIVNLDGANHPINYNIVSIGDGSQTQVPIQNVFKAAILSNASGILLFHNHPSGSLIASREDILLTRRLVEAGKLMNIPVVDHIIIAGRTGRHYSFRENNADLFSLMEKDESSLHEPQAKLDPNKLMVRPTYRHYGVYESIGMNRARVIFEGSKEECHEKIRELRENCQTAEKIAAEVDRLAYEYDTSKYNEIVKDRRAQVESIAVDIRNGDIEYINKFLKVLASDSLREGIIDMFGKGIQPADSARVQMMCKAREVQEQLAEYSLLSKGRDNAPPSLPPAGDEKNAPPQEKAEHIAERNKTHSRISIKEKLAEKKAEIAVKTTKYHKIEETKNPPNMEID